MDQDRYLDLSKAENGVLSVYFLQGEEQIFYSGQDIKEGQRILKAQYDDVNRISFTLYHTGLSKEQAEKLTVSIEEEGGNVYPLKELELVWEGNLIKGKGILEEAVKRQ